MALRIGYVGAHPDGVRMLFLFDIAEPIAINGENVVPTPADAMKGEIAQRMLSAENRAALDAGTMAFQLVTAELIGVDAAEKLASAQALYADKKAAFEEGYALRYGGLVGQWFDADPGAG